MFAQIPSLIQRAVQLFQAGDLQQASRLLRQVLDLQPRNFDALHILGVIRAMEGDRSAAIDLFRKALSISRNNNFLQFNLAKALSESGQQSEALRHHRKATELAPQHTEAWLGYGQCLASLGRLEEALAAYEKALTLAPSYTEAWNNKGLVLKQLQRHADALAALEQALALRPELAEAHYNKGVVLDALGRSGEALASYTQAVELKPDYAQAWNNKGATLAALDRSDEALICYDQALKLQPAFPQACNNKGSALTELGRDGEAQGCYEQAIQLAPDYADAHLTLGHLLLKEGNYSAGWEKFEYRWLSQEQAPRKLRTRRPLWNGQPSDRPLLLWGEQGIGDQVLYASILPELADLPQRKFVALDRRLIPLLARSMPGFEFIDLEQLSDALDFAEQLPLGSLPRYFRPSLESFAAARHPYLLADPARAAVLRQKLAQPGKRVCGVSWSSARKVLGQHKSISLAQMLTPLASAPLHFVNLQYGDTTAERQALRAEHGIAMQNLDEVDNFHDIDGLAALIAACDIVITTSNSTAHLAGALGKETLLLLPLGKGKFWYWAELGGKNPWYPSIKTFSQATPGDWQPPLERLKAHIENKSWN